MAVLNSDRALLLRHMQLTTKTLRQLPQVDAQKIMAIGFCFGSKRVLDLAHSSTYVQAVIACHGVVLRAMATSMRGRSGPRRIYLCSDR